MYPKSTTDFIHDRYIILTIVVHPRIKLQHKKLGNKPTVGKPSTEQRSNIDGVRSTERTKPRSHGSFVRIYGSTFGTYWYSTGFFFSHLQKTICISGTHWYNELVEVVFFFLPSKNNL
jgi:hypothetical protein